MKHILMIAVFSTMTFGLIAQPEKDKSPKESHGCCKAKCCAQNEACNPKAKKADNAKTSTEKTNAEEIIRLGDLVKKYDPYYNKPDSTVLR